MKPPIYSLRNYFNRTTKYKGKYIGNPPKVPSRLPFKWCSKLAVSQILRAAKTLVLSEPMAIFHPRDKKIVIS